MFKVGICMENKTKKEELFEEIMKWKTKNGLRIFLKTYTSGEELVKCMSKDKPLDLLFTDAVYDSIEMQSWLLQYRFENERTKMVQVGKNETEDAMKLQIYHASAIEYPLKTEQIYQLAKKEYRRYYTDDKSYVFMKRPQFIKIALKKIMYFTSVQRKIKAVCIDGSVYEFYQQLDSVEEELRGKQIRFVRTHQSHLINSQYIDGFYGNEVFLKNGERLTIAATRRRRVRSQFQMMNIRC